MDTFKCTTLHYSNRYLVNKNLALLGFFLLKLLYKMYEDQRSLFCDLSSFVKLLLETE